MELRGLGQKSQTIKGCRKNRTERTAHPGTDRRRRAARRSELDPRKSIVSDVTSGLEELMSTRRIASMR
jgi:hypothetical protein